MAPKESDRTGGRTTPAAAAAAAAASMAPKESDRTGGRTTPAAAAAAAATCNKQRQSQRNNHEKADKEEEEEKKAEAAEDATDDAAGVQEEDDGKPAAATTTATAAGTGGSTEEGGRDNEGPSAAESNGDLAAELHGTQDDVEGDDDEQTGQSNDAEVAAAQPQPQPQPQPRHHIHRTQPPSQPIHPPPPSEQLDARFRGPPPPSPPLYQGAPASLARSPTTLLPPTHPLYLYTNARPPPECLTYLFPPGTRPHIHSPTDSCPGSPVDTADADADADASSICADSTCADSNVAQPAATAAATTELRRPRPHRFVNPRHLVRLPPHVEQYLEDSDLDDPLLRQFHALTIDLPDRPWNGGAVTRGFHDPRLPRPTPEERERRREERRRRYAETQRAQQQVREARLAAERRAKAVAKDAEGGESEESESESGSDDEDSGSDDSSDESESGSDDDDSCSEDEDGKPRATAGLEPDNVRSVGTGASLLENLERLDLASDDDDDEGEGSDGNDSSSSSSSSGSSGSSGSSSGSSDSSGPLGSTLETLLAVRDPNGKMDRAIRTALANCTPSSDEEDKDEGVASSDDDEDDDDYSDDESEEDDEEDDEMEAAVAPSFASNRGALFAEDWVMSPDLPPPMGGIGMGMPGMMAEMTSADLMMGLGDISGGGMGFGLGLPAAATGTARRRNSNGSTDSEDMYINTSGREPLTDRIRYRNRRTRAARAARAVCAAGGGRGDGNYSDDSSDGPGMGPGKGGGGGGLPMSPFPPGRRSRKTKPAIMGPNGEPIPVYALHAELHTKAVRRLLYVSNEIKIDWGTILHRILQCPEEASEYTGHQAPTLLLCFERRAPLPVIEALVYNDKNMPYHQDGSGDTALHYFCGGYDIPSQPKKYRDHFPRYTQYLCDKNPRLATFSNCAGVLPVHTSNDFECSSILIKAAPESIMFRSIFDGQTALHSRCDYFINMRDDTILVAGGEGLFMKRDESPPIVRMLVEEGLNLTWDVLSDATVHNSKATSVPGYDRLALGGVMIKDKTNRSPFHRICQGINNKLTDDGRAKEYYYDKVLHMLLSKLRTFAEASYVASVYEANRRKQKERFVENGGTEEEARKLPHKRITIDDVGTGPDDPPYFLLHELIRLRVPGKIIMHVMRNKDEEVKAVGRYDRKALHLAAEAGYNYDVLKVMIDVDPEVVDQPDPLTGFLPFMLASLSRTKFIETDSKNKDNERLTSVFRLLVASPHTAEGILGTSEFRKSPTLGGRG
eukprot:CAMPEP_0181070074 /NCGR_PEP_ID=MMETSP1070-20121207/27290_1 /TAXON_ID=265543 /ORGANISM="Minutocellus polymorphus, Strain NH13" /LENGTH=1248 /DNA_ID=CAMNT_0023150931 /DNA_START=131 /DNA_END=3877 /DNA_ORIENTATION=+